jgi:competence protein ComEA
MRFVLILGCAVAGLGACASSQKLPVVDARQVEPAAEPAKAAAAGPDLAAIQPGRLATADAACPGQVNVNIASEQELQCLPGLGKERIDDIIQGRPYWAIEDLVRKKVLPQSVYDQVADKIMVN